MSIPTKTRSLLCGRCAAQGRTCCQTARVVVTGGDVGRIAAHTGSGDFFERVAVASDLFDRDLDPSYARLFRDDTPPRLLRRVGNGCVFLDDDGCRLPLSVRPLICRLYPFDYNETAIKGVYAPLCPEPERGNAPLLLALLGMNRDEAEGWRRMLYEEIEADVEE